MKRNNFSEPSKRFMHQAALGTALLTLTLSLTSPAAAVTYNRGTHPASGSITTGVVLQDTADTSGRIWNGSGYNYYRGNNTIIVNFSGITDITGNIDYGNIYSPDTVYNNWLTTSGITLSTGTVNITGGTTTVSGSVANSGNNDGARLNVNANATLMVAQNLGPNIVVGVVQNGATLGVQGNINSAVSINSGGTLKIGGSTTGLNNVTVNSGTTGATISNYGSNNLNLSTTATNKPVLNITGNGALNIVNDSSGGNINFNNDFKVNSITGNGNLNISTSDGNITFRKFEHDTGVYAGGVSIYAGGTNKDVTFTDSFTTDLNGGALSIVTNNGNVNFNGAFSHTNGAGANVDIQSGGTGKVNFGDTFTTSMAGGTLNILANNGDVNFNKAFSHTGSANGDVNIKADGTGKVNFSDTFTTSMNGGRLSITTNSQDINFTRAFSHTNTAAGDVLIEVPGIGKIHFGQAADFNMTGGDLIIRTRDNEINFSDTFTHVNSAAGAVTIETTHTGRINFGNNVSTSLNGGDLTIAAKDGNIRFGADYSHSNSGPGDMTIAVGTAGNTINVLGNLSGSLNGGNTAITTIQGDITVGGNYTHSNTGTGNVYIGNQDGGQIRFNGNVSSTMAGGNYTMYSKNGNILIGGDLKQNNTGAGNYALKVETSGNTITVGGDTDITLSGGDLSITTINGDLAFHKTFTHTNTAVSANGAYIEAGQNGKITFGDQVTTSMRGGPVSILTTNGDIKFTQGFSHTNAAAGDVLVSARKSGDITFGNNVTSSMIGGKYTIYAKNGDIIVNGNLQQTNTGAGDYTVAVGTAGNVITVTGDTDVRLAGGKALFETIDGDIDFQGKFNHANSAIGGLDILAKGNGKITVGNDFTVSMAGGDANILTNNGNIHFKGIFSQDNSALGDLNVQTGSAGNTITFDKDVTIALTGGQSMISTVDGDITLGGALTHTNSANSPAGTNRNGGFNLIAGGSGSISVAGAVNSTMAGGVFNVLTDNGTILFQDVFNHQNSANGDLNISAQTGGNITFGNDFASQLTGGTLNVVAKNGNITFAGITSHTDNGASGDLNILAQTAGNTISFDKDLAIKLNGGQALIQTADGDITLGGALTHTNSANSPAGTNRNGGFNLIAGGSGSISVAGAVNSTMAGGVFNVLTSTGNITFNDVFVHNNTAAGDLNISSQTKGNIDFKQNFTSQLSGGTLNVIAENGNIHFAGTTTHKDNGLNGNLNVLAQTAGNTIMFDKAFNATLTGSGGSQIVTRAGDIIFGNTLTYQGVNGNLLIDAGNVGNVSVAGAVNATLTNGSMSVQTATGDILFSDVFNQTATGTGSLYVQSQTAGNIDFMQNVTISHNGGDTYITTAGSDITLHAALTYTNTANSANGFNMLAGGNGNVKVAGVVNSRMFGGDFNVATQNGNIDFQSAFDHANTAAGDANILAQVKGNITFASTFTNTLADGALNVVAKNGDIVFTGTSAITGQSNTSDVNILAQTAGNTIGFMQNLAISQNGGQTLIQTADGNITLGGALSHTNTANSPSGANRNGGFNMIAGGSGNISVAGTTTSNMQGGVFNVITYNGAIHFKDTVSHANSAAGNANIVSQTKGNVTFDKNVTTQLTGSDMNILAQDGDILFSGTYTHTDSSGGNLNIQSGTADNTITFKDAVNISLNGAGATMISTPDGNVTFDNVLNYKGLDGNLIVDAGVNGDIYFNYLGTNTIDFSGGTGHAYFKTQNGQVHVVGHFNFIGGTGDLYKEAQDGTIPGDIREADSSFAAGGGSAFYAADNNINMNYAAGARDLNYDFSGQTSGGLGMVAGRDIILNTNFNYTGGQGAGMANPPTADLTLHGENVAGYGLYLKAQNHKDGVHDASVSDPSVSVLNFEQNASIIMNGQKGLISSPYLNNKGTVLFDTHTGAGADTGLLVETDYWTLYDDLTINGGKTLVTSLDAYDPMALGMPELTLQGTNAVNAVADDHILVTFMNSDAADRPYLNVFNKIYADSATVSFHTAQTAGADEYHDSNLRTVYLTLTGHTAVNGHDAANTGIYESGVFKLVGTFAELESYTAPGFAAMYGAMGKETYYDPTPGLGFGSPGEAGVLYVGESLDMDGGRLALHSVDSQVVFNNSYVLDPARGGFSSAANPLVLNSKIDWQEVDLYAWMNLRDARTVMAAAMVPEVYAYPDDELLTDPLQMGYQNRVWFSVDNTGLSAAESITLADIPGFETISAYNPFPDSPFFNLELGYLNDDKTEWGLVDFSRKMYDGTTPANLENQAPNPALGSMAAVIEASPELDIMNNPALSADPADGVNLNTVENVLYLSPTRHDYNKSLAAISAGGNLDAVRMVDYGTLGSIFSRLGQKTIRTCAGTFTGYGSGIWGKANYRRLEMDDNFSKGYGGFDIDSIGVTAGYDVNIADNYVIGGFLSYNNADLDGWQRDIDADDLQIGIYGQAILPADFTVSAGIMLGWQNYDLKRNVHFGRDFLHNASVSYHDRIKADFDGHSMQFAMEIAKTFCLTENIYFRPALGYSYQRTKLDSYTEKSQTYFDADAGSSVAQKVGSSTYEQHLISIGASAGYQSNTFALNLGASWVFNGGDKQARAKARFANALSTEGSQAFRIYGAKYDDNFVNVNASIMYAPASVDGLSLGLQYDGMFSSKETAHAVSATITFTF